MTAITWKSAVNGDWATAADWSTDTVPGSADNVTINVSGSPTYTVAVTQGETAHSLTVDAIGLTLSITNGFTIATTLAVDAGILSVGSGGSLNGGPVTNAGLFTLADGAAITVSGDFTNSGELGFNSGSSSISGTLDNTGLTQIGPNNDTLNGTATLTVGGLTNSAGANFLMYGSPTHTATLAFNDGGTGFILNAGTFEASYTAPLILNSSFTNTGLFTLADGAAITLSGDFTNSGELGFNSGNSSISGTLDNTGLTQIGPNNDTLNGTATLTVGGLTNSAGANFLMYGSPTHTATLAFNDGGTGFILNAGTFEASYTAPLILNSSFTNTGLFTLADGAAITLSGDFTNSGELGFNSGSSSISGTLDNTGLTQIGPNNNTLNGPATLTVGGLTNSVGAHFLMYGSPTHTATLAFKDGGTGFILNAGTFEASYTAPLILNSSFTNTGLFTLADGAAITLSGDFTNSGELGFNSGSSSISGTFDNTGLTQIGPNNNTLNGPATLTVGGLTNSVGAHFLMYGSPTHTATLAFNDGGTGFILNAGTFEASYTAPLILNSSFTNTGLFTLADGAAITLSGDFTNSGELGFNSGSSSISGTLDNTGLTQIGPNNYTLNGAATLTVGGSENSGTISLYGGSSTVAATLLVTGLEGNTSIINIGSYSAFNVTGGNAFTQTAGTTTVLGMLTATSIDIFGGVLAIDSTNFTNNSTLWAAGGGLINFTNGGLTNLSGTTLTGGTYEVDAGSTLQLPNNTSITTLAADLTLSGTGSVVESLNTGTHVQVQVESMLTTIAAGGVLRVLGGRNYSTTNAINDSGVLEIGADTFQAASATVAGGGKLTVDAGGTLHLGSPLVVNGTVTNAGMIDGGGATAVTFGSGTDRLMLDPGATFLGAVVGGGANTTLELAQGSAAGTLDALGTNFINFGTVLVDPGASWTVDAATSLLATTTFIGDGESSTLVLTGTGTFGLSNVSDFGTIDLPADNNTVTVTDATLSGGTVTINDGPSGNNSVTAAGDTAASTGRTLIYNAGSGTDSFIGGFENDTVNASAAAIGSDTLTGGSGTNALTLTGAGSVNLGEVSAFATIDLGAGNSAVTVTDTTLSGGSVTINDDVSGNNSVSAVGDTAASKGKWLTYFAGSGTDSFTGGFENDVVHVSAAALPGDTLTGGSGTNTLVLTSAGSINLGAVTNFSTVDLFAGSNTVYVSAAAVSSDVLVGGSGTNTLVLTGPGTVNLSGVSNFGKIDLAAGNNTVTLTHNTLSDGSVALHDGASGNNSVSAAGDTSASTGNALTYYTGSGTDSFTGGFENDTVYVSAAAVGGDTLTGGSANNALTVTTAGTFSLGGVSKFATIFMAAGNNTVTLTDKTLSGGTVALHAPSGNNCVSAAGDTAASIGKTLTYYAGTGTDCFTGGFENDTVYVSAAAVGGDTLTGGSGNNVLNLTTAGTFSLGGVSKFGTVFLAAGNNTVTVTHTTLSGGTLGLHDGASGNNTISAAGDTVGQHRQVAELVTPVAGTDHFTGGFENDTVHVSSAAVGGDTLTGGSGNNVLNLTTAGTFGLGGASKFATIYLAAGNNTVTVTAKTLSGGTVGLHDGASGNNTVSAAGDTSAAGRTLTYFAGSGTDTFTGGFENDTVDVSAAAVGGDTLTGGSGVNQLALTTSGAANLGGISKFGIIYLAAGGSTVTIGDKTLSGGAVALHEGTSNNSVSAAGDTSASTGKSLIYYTGSGTDSFTGGFENDTVRVSAAAISGDTLTGGSGANQIQMTTAGTFSLGGVSKFANVYLVGGNNTVTVTDTTLSGGTLSLHAGASGNNSISAAGDTSASIGKTLSYYALNGTDTFTGGFENDTVDVRAAQVGGDTLTGGSGNNQLVLATSGGFSLGGVSKFANIYLAAGTNTVTLTDKTLSGGAVGLHGGATGNNSVSAAGDTSASTGKSLTYSAGTGTDHFTGGFENDTVRVSAAAVGGDTLTGGSGNNVLNLTTAGTFSLGGASKFGTVFLAAGNNTVTVTDTTLSGGAVGLHDGASGNNSVSAAGDTSASTGKSLTYYAGAGTDSFTGGFENDTIFAGTGSGTYTFGLGNDKLMFIADNLPTQTVDSFNVTNDSIVVYGIHATNGFDLGSTDNGMNPLVPTAIDPSIFVANASGAFTSSSQRFAYDTSNGQLFYSATGSNSSESHIATLAGAPGFTASNLLFEH